ncbi:MAG TPA: hypothetical protein VFN22_07205 [Gemmatimonadales bacterium]|nr:hypothetical protein [Gemmatimonadales bacterium]
MLRRLTPLAAAVLISTMTASTIHAQTQVSITGHAATLGAGLELGVRSGRIGVRGGINTFGWTYRQKLSSISSEIDLKFRGKSAMIDLYPSRGGSFHLTGGVVTAPIRLHATGTPSLNHQFVLNGHAYWETQVGTLIGNAEWPDLSPYAGLGWSGSMGGPRVKAVLDLGVVFGGPTFTLKASNATEGSQLAADVKAERDQIQHDLDRYASVFPVLSLGVRVGL